MCLGGIALLQRPGLTVSQEAVTACQKSAEGIVGEVHRRALARLTRPRRPERFLPRVRQVNGVASR